MCEQLIVEGESGVIIGYVRDDGAGTAPEHIECFLRSVLGSVPHMEGRCSCHGGTEDAQGRYRAQARETMEWLMVDRAKQV